MERKTFSVVFFCKKTKVTRKGKAPIYARITTQGVSTEVYTQCQIEPQKWNQRAERSLFRDQVSQQINDIVASYRANILAAYDQLIREGREPNCFAIKQRLDNPHSGMRMFLAELDSIATNGRKKSASALPNSRRTNTIAYSAIYGNTRRRNTAKRIFRWSR